MTNEQAQTLPAATTPRRLPNRWITGTGAGLGLATTTLAMTTSAGDLLGPVGVVAGVLLGMGIAIER